MKKALAVFGLLFLLLTAYLSCRTPAAPTPRPPP